MILLLQIPWILEGLHDYHYIRKGQRPNKTLGIIIRIVLAAYISGNIAFYVPGDNYSLFLNYFIASMFFHGAFFNLYLNTLRGKSWNYLGNNWVDNQLKWFGELLWLWYAFLAGTGTGMYFLNTTFYV